MYFQNFPYTYYSLDDIATTQIVTNISLRVRLSDELKNNFALFDKYDIKDGETPEILADKFYSNPQLHWIILHTNDILDPRFDWPLTTNNLVLFAQGKYNNVNAPHHYVDANSIITNANVFLNSSSQFTNFNNNDVIVNVTNNGTGVITKLQSYSNIIVTVTDGGFITGDKITLSSNANANANITSTSIISGTPVTNLQYEDTLNDTKRKINILKNRYIDSVISDFKIKLSSI
jgi:hypothetical protein